MGTRTSKRDKNGNKVGTNWEQEPQSGTRMGTKWEQEPLSGTRMRTKWEKSGNKNPKVGQEWELGTKIQTRGLRMRENSFTFQCSFAQCTHMNGRHGLNPSQASWFPARHLHAPRKNGKGMVVRQFCLYVGLSGFMLLFNVCL